MFEGGQSSRFNSTITSEKSLKLTARTGLTAFNLPRASVNYAQTKPSAYDESGSKLVFAFER